MGDLRRLEPREAAEKLMDDAHITVVGSRDCADHVALIEKLAGLMPGCALLTAQAQRSEALDRDKAVWSVGVDGSQPAALLLFVPDSPVTRAAVLGAFIAAMGVEQAAQTFGAVEPDLKGPIIMLTGADGLERSYVLILNALRAVKEGRGVCPGEN